MRRPRSALVADSAVAAEPRDLAVAAARAIDEKMGADIQILDLRGRSQVADFFVVATGKVQAHLAAMGRAAVERMAGLGVRPLSLRESAGSAGWVLMDYGPVVVHAFLPELRAYYDLELLWGDAPRIEWQEPAAPEGEEKEQ